MFLKRLLTVLQLIINILIGFVGVWIVVYGLEKLLTSLLGEDKYLQLYHVLTTLISISGIIVIFLAILFAIGVAMNKKDS